MWPTTLALLALVATVHPATTGCKSCVTLGKEEKAMFREHSESCLQQSAVSPELVEGMLRGHLPEDDDEQAALRKHVYCVLLKCKIISKDGKLRKTAVLGKMAARPNAKNVTKIVEQCADQAGDSPEDLAWKIFRCGYDKKAVLFDYMPTDGDVDNHA